MEGNGRDFGKEREAVRGCWGRARGRGREVRTLERAQSFCIMAARCALVDTCARVPSSPAQPVPATPLASRVPILRLSVVAPHVCVRMRQESGRHRPLPPLAPPPPVAAPGPPKPPKRGPPPSHPPRGAAMPSHCLGPHRTACAFFSPSVRLPHPPHTCASRAHAPACPLPGCRSQTPPPPPPPQLLLLLPRLPGLQRRRARGAARGGRGLGRGLGAHGHVV